MALQPKPECTSQLSLPRALQWKLKRDPAVQAYTILNRQPSLPCNHGTIRVKIKEPGLYIRVCDVCKLRWGYVLEVSGWRVGCLAMRWLRGAGEIEEWTQREMEDCDE